MMQAQVEKLEARVQDLERQSAKMGGRTEMNEAEMDTAPARKKRRVVKSEWQEELDLLSDADLAKLLQMMKSLVEAREELIEEKRQLASKHGCRRTSIPQHQILRNLTTRLKSGELFSNSV